MNLPNKLTSARLVLAPVMFLWFFSDKMICMPAGLYSAVLLIILGIMELTDLLDGKIARKKNLVTDLGKVMDPFADVVQHLTFFTCFTVSGIMPVVAFVIILWRELAQSFLRMLLMGKGTPMAANFFGKAKTCLYALSSLCGFSLKIIKEFEISLQWFGSMCTFLFYLASAASAISFIIYIYRVKKSGNLSSLTR